MINSGLVGEVLLPTLKLMRDEKEKTMGDTQGIGSVKVGR
jgi:hypothetical protein